MSKKFKLNLKPRNSTIAIWLMNHISNGKRQNKTAKKCKSTRAGKLNLEN